MPSEGISVVAVERGNRPLIRAFIDLGEGLSLGEALRIPALRSPQAEILGARSPFYRRGEAASFLALRGGNPVARVTVFFDRPYNDYHNRREARFCWFECASSSAKPEAWSVEATLALFSAAATWALARGLTELRGPYSIAGLEGAGLLVEGFEEAQTMGMSAWNPPLYPALLEAAGFTELKDLLSTRLVTADFSLPEKVERVAGILRARGRFSVLPLRTLPALLGISTELGLLYERSFAEHDDFMPLGREDYRDLARGLALLTEPALVKIIGYDGRPAGFLFGFPDLSRALRRARGRLRAWNLVDLALEKRRARRLVVNGAGIDPERQRLGGTALLYSELHEVVRRRGFESIEMVQIATSNAPMLRELGLLGAEVFKRHRIYRRSILP